MVLEVVFERASSLAAQPTGVLEGRTWWGGSVWILVTLALVVLAFILASAAARRPNRR